MGEVGTAHPAGRAHPSPPASCQARLTRYALTELALLARSQLCDGSSEPSERETDEARRGEMSEKTSRGAPAWYGGTRTRASRLS